MNFLDEEVINSLFNEKIVDLKFFLRHYYVEYNVVFNNESLKKIDILLNENNTTFKLMTDLEYTCLNQSICNNNFKPLVEYKSDIELTKEIKPETEKKYKLKFSELCFQAKTSNL